jgi:hypothetical protein
MKAFGLAFTIWGGTILLNCGFFIVSGIFTLDVLLIGGGVIGFFVALFVTCPLLIPATLLINLTRKIPYHERVLVFWLGFALIALNYLFWEVFTWFDFFIIDRDFQYPVFFISSAGIVLMLIFKRTALKEFFSQQTTNKNL